MINFVQWDGVDDHLHQVADPSLWPEGIVCDPENDGIPIGSLGVHEHWNNATDKQYSRNLGNGDGIELVHVSSPTDVNDNYFPLLDKDFRLYSNYPNPFNSVTVIRFQVKEENHVILNILNARGQKVRTLVDGEYSSGLHDVRFEGHDLASGVYICQFIAGDYVESKRLLLVK